MLYSYTIKLVRYYNGADGLKTGFTDKAMYCLTATAKKNNMRLITVVMGEPNSTTRSSETATMLDYGFNTYKLDTILSSKKILSKYKINLGEKETVNVVAKEDITILNKNTDGKRNVTYKLKLDTIKAPVKIGDKVGKIEVIENDQIIMEITATVDANIKKANIFTIYLRDLKDIISGMI